MLNASTLPSQVALCGSESRARLLALLVSEFKLAFGNIEYEVDNQSRVVNAQAFVRGGSRFVRLYGGFALHPLVSVDSLVFTLLHETGHHRARGRRFAGNPKIACDCLADKWALTVGARTLRRCSGRSLNLCDALDSLNAVIGPVEAATKQLPAWQRRSQRLHACWGGCWPTRKLLLNSGNAPEPSGSCYFYS